MKRRSHSIVVIITTFLAVFALSGALTASTMALSQEQAGAISQSCGSIKQSLRSLQKADSRMRVLLGTTYQTLLVSYITPLNLRLVKDNRPDTALTALQGTLSEQRDRFSQQFISYSQSLEELIATDCINQPEEFYTKLEQSRSRRARLAQTVSDLQATITQHHTSVTSLYDELKEEHE